MSEQELVKRESTELPVNPMQLLSIAVQQGADIDKLEKLMALQERWEANNARKAFTVAMAKFKENPPKIVKDTQVSYKTDKGTTNYMHAKLDQVTEVIARALSAVEISHRFAIDQTDKGIMVHCVLTHVLGHSERTSLAACADTSGGKNAIQGVGSTVSYLQRYTLLAATGLATGEGDDDGQGSEPTISEKQLGELRDLLAALERREDSYVKYLKLKSLDSLPAKNFEFVKAELSAFLKNKGAK